ncbi:MAG: substrate-binding domain-containing protein, partial [Clostridia bacterium]
REKGYLQYIEQCGKKPVIIDIKQDIGIFESGMEAYERIKKSYPKVEAVFAVSDLIAAGVAKAMTNDKQPKKLAIFGFDDTAITKISTPTLSTVRQPRYDIGYTSAKLLMQLMNGHEIDKIVTLEHSLVIRESTK